MAARAEYGITEGEGVIEIEARLKTVLKLLRVSPWYTMVPARLKIDELFSTGSRQVYSGAAVKAKRAARRSEQPRNIFCSPAVKLC